MFGRCIWSTLSIARALVDEWRPDSGQGQCVAPPLAVLRPPEVQEQVRAAGLSYRRKIFEAQEQSLAALWRCSEAIVAQQGSKRGTAALGTQRAVFTPVRGAPVHLAVAPEREA